MKILEKIKKFFTPDNGETPPLIPKQEVKEKNEKPWAIDIMRKYRQKNIKQFPDLGFKMLVVDGLLEQGYYKDTLGKMLDTHEDNCATRDFKDYEQMKKGDNLEDWTDAENLSTDILDYIVALEIPQEYLDTITELTYDGGNEIYRIMYDWDGEDEMFDIESVQGFEQLKNLKSVDLLAGYDKAFEPMKKAGIEINT